MATYLENLITARDAIAAAIAANPIRDSYNIDGQQVSRADLSERLKSLNDSIAANDCGEYESYGLL